MRCTSGPSWLTSWSPHKMVPCITGNSLIPKHLRLLWVQNCFKTTPFWKQGCAKLGPFLALPIVKFCSQLVFLHVHQILHTHSLPFARPWYSKLKKKVFFYMLKMYINLLGARKTIFWNRYGSRDFKFLFLYPNLISMRHMKPWEKRHFAQRGMLKFTYVAVFRQ